jgi:S-formylglutathione hydrolase
MKTISENRCLGACRACTAMPRQATGCDMTFGLFLPKRPRIRPVPVLWYLSGLTCTHENAMTKAGAQKWAAEAGIALVFPDTSPRGADVANDEAYDLGQGAGFYVNATQKPPGRRISACGIMSPTTCRGCCSTPSRCRGSAQSITGHSMGGHGALTIGMSFPGRFRSVSAFAPICQPDGKRLGPQAVHRLSGRDEAKWAPHDATLLMRSAALTARS